MYDDKKGRFGDRKDSRGGRGGFKKFGDRDDRAAGPVVLHEAVCADCGNTCKVPFKPNGKKPVFCGDCFRKGENGGGNSNYAPRRGAVSVNSEMSDLDQINRKLDKILDLLQS